MGKDDTEDLGKQVHTLILLNAAQLVKDVESLKDKVFILDSLGLSRSDIGLVCNTSADSVRSLVSQAKKSKKKSKKKS